VKPAEEIGSMNNKQFEHSLDDLLLQVAGATQIFSGRKDAWSWGFYLYHTITDTIDFYHGFKSEMAHRRTKTAAVLSRSIYEAYTRLHEVNDPLDVDDKEVPAEGEASRPLEVDQDDFMRSWLAFNHQEYVRFLNDLLQHDKHMMRDSFIESATMERDRIQEELSGAPTKTKRNWKNSSHIDERRIREHLWREIGEGRPDMAQRVHRIMQTWASSYVHMNITHAFWADLVTSVVPVTVCDFMQIAMGLCYRKEVMGIRALMISKQFNELLQATAAHIDERAG